MIKKLILTSILLIAVSGCNKSDGQNIGMMGGGMMMGGSGMMGEIKIPGSPPPEETGAKYQQGYREAKITCSQCHALPDPDQHSRSEWPNVIARMEEHIKTYHKILPDEDTLKSIVDYYVGNSN